MFCPHPKKYLPTPIQVCTVCMFFYVFMLHYVYSVVLHTVLCCVHYVYCVVCTMCIVLCALCVLCCVALCVLCCVALCVLCFVLHTVLCCVHHVHCVVLHCVLCCVASLCHYLLIYMKIKNDNLSGWVLNRK